MKKISLPVETRSETGKGPARRLRAGGRVPAVFYGKKTEPINLSVDSHEFRKLTEHAGKNPMLNLEIQDNGKTTTRMAVIKEKQVKPIDGALVHLDFIEIFMDETIEVGISLTFTGKPVGVEQGGMLQPNMRSIVVACLPGDVPEAIDVDVSELDIGSAIHVGDLILPEGVVAAQEADLSVVSVVMPKRVEEEVEEAEGEELEGKAAEGAEEGEKAEGEEKSDSAEEKK